MEKLRVVRLSSVASLIVQLRDSHTGGPPIGAKAGVRLKDVPAVPVVRPDGVYVFNNVPSGAYRLVIDSAYYFRIEQDIRVDHAGTIAPVSLLPLSSYPYRSGETLLRYRAVDVSGQPIALAEMTVTVVSEACARYRLAGEEAKPGDTELDVTPDTQLAAPGQRFVIRSRTDGRVAEPIAIAAADGRSRLTLAEPLRNAFPRGSLLLPKFSSLTDERGEGTVSFPGCRARWLQAELSVRSPDGHTGEVREIGLQEGMTTNLGAIWLPS